MCSSDLPSLIIAEREIFSFGLCFETFQAQNFILCKGHLWAVDRAGICDSERSFEIIENETVKEWMVWIGTDTLKMVCTDTKSKTVAKSKGFAPILSVPGGCHFLSSLTTASLISNPISYFKMLHDASISTQLVDNQFFDAEQKFIESQQL